MTSRTRLATAVVAAVLALSACSSGGSDRSGPSTSAGQQATSTTEAPAGSGSGAPADSTTSSTTKDGGGGDTAEVSSVGTFGVGMASFDFEDPSRQTPANGSAAAHPGRQLVGLVWYPSTGKAPGGDKVPEAAEGAAAHTGRFPLVIFSHGVTGKATFYNQVLRAWASAGYVVVAPDYPLSNLDAPGGPTVSDVGQQPGDASFVLDQFLGDAKSAKELPAPLAKVADHIDGDHIAAVGHSLGAITSLGLGYATCCTDDRIDAVA
ncbi:MAG: alpha/beta hydrolase family protein, partial [Acidimicrobiales bacterium]